MIGMTNYLNAYVDRRMQMVVEEWDLARHPDIADFSDRLSAIEAQIPALKASSHAAADKLTELENRARRLKERA